MRIITIIFTILGILLLIRLTQVYGISEIFNFTNNPLIKPKKKKEDNRKLLEMKSDIEAYLSEYLTSSTFLVNSSSLDVIYKYIKVNEHREQNETIIYSEGLIKYRNIDTNKTYLKYSLITYNTDKGYEVTPTIYNLLELEYHTSGGTTIDSIELSNSNTLEKYMNKHKIRNKAFKQFQEKTGIFELKKETETEINEPISSINITDPKFTDNKRNLDKNMNISRGLLLKIKDYNKTIEDIDLSISISELIDNIDIVMEKIHKEKTNGNITSELVSKSKELSSIIKKEKDYLTDYLNESLDGRTRESIRYDILNETDRDLTKLETLLD